MDEQIRSILAELFPDEVDLLGDELVDDLLQARNSSHLDLPGKDRLNVAPVYEFLKAAAKAITKAKQEYDIWKIRHAKANVTFKIGNFSYDWSGTDPAMKEAIATNFTRIVSVFEAHVQAQDTPRSMD